MKQKSNMKTRRVSTVVTNAHERQRLLQAAQNYWNTVILAQFNEDEFTGVDDAMANPDIYIKLPCGTVRVLTSGCDIGPKELNPAEQQAVDELARAAADFWHTYTGRMEGDGITVNDLPLVGIRILSDAV